ncbi:MAG: AAA family ATPase [Rhodococcus sp.]|nr:AAA family ATPase [Rhodococcus sp. (in: high G+C Gram-positive bacteria)]
MRLHHLEVTSFGPFADTVTVDFDRLGADGLFLLHGQTGAGKTTVLDAVAFALYGTVPGARRDGKRLLSDHAPAGSVPRVELEATIGGRRLRLTRSPEFARPKKRGSGSIVENAKATLTWLDGVGENLSRIPDIADEVGRLMGMSADQFFQVVLLPQGEFARFLRADNEDRGRLLERLFDTKKFGTVEEWFAARRKSSQSELWDAEREVDLLVAKISAASGLEVGADADPVAWATKLSAQLAETRDVQSEELARTKAAAAVSHAALSEAHRVLELHMRRDRARAELARHEADASVRAGLTAELEAARRAVPVASISQDLADAHAAADDATRALEEAERTLRGVVGSEPLFAELSWPPKDEEREVVRLRIREWGDEVVRLDAALEDEKALESSTRSLTELRSARDTCAAATAEVASELEGLPARLQRAEEAWDAARRADESVGALESDHKRAVDAESAAVELRGRRTELATAQKTAAAAESEFLDARSHVLDLRERRIAGMAAELAARLVDGEPCQVCGSAEHPHPAFTSEDTVTKADEECAVATEHLAEAARTVAHSAVTTIERAIVVLEQRGGDGDLDELSAAAASAKAALVAAQDLAGSVQETRTRLDDVKASESALAARARELDRESAALDEKISAAGRAVEDLRGRVESAAGDDTSIASRRRRIHALVTGASKFSDLRDEAVAAGSDVDTLVRKADSAAGDAGFADVEMALAAVRTAQWQRETQTRLEADRDVEVGARAVLAEPEIEALGDGVPPSVEDAQSVHAARTAAVDAAVADASEAERRLQDVERHARQLMEAIDRVAPRRAAHEELAALAELVAGRGQNARKMSLRSYVLAARLEEVALSASVRLRRMSGGRYEFVHSDEAGPRGKRGGLGLDIRDDYTGTVRSAKTLSGGESFLASLSLALGLADVVAAESGGVVLDTMFIDEGFGTLDADTLDSVMSVLDELRDGGRVVGIVSHVDEMRQRIPSRLHVIRGRAGSTLELVAG